VSGGLADSFRRLNDESTTLSEWRIHLSRLNTVDINAVLCLQGGV
jgi:hypothetical protein